MPSKSSKPGFYAVKKGRNIGIYESWPDCEAQVKGFQGAQFQKFTQLNDAQKFISPTYSKGVQRQSQPTASASQSTASRNRASGTPSPDKSKSAKRPFTTGLIDPTGWDIVYSDGACKGNGKRGSVAGIGVWWGPNDSRNLAERCPGDQTNNRAELIAILRVLETTPISSTPLMIRTDSQYSANCFGTWIFNWQQNDWKTKEGQPVKNAGIIRCVSRCLGIRAKVGQRVHLEYVKGHSGDVGNDGADAMANEGCLMPMLADRDWDALELELARELNDMDFERAAQTLFSVTNVESPLPEHRDKAQKLAHQDSTVSTSSLWSPSMPSLSQFSATSSQSSGAVDASEVNIHDFVDCVLDDDDLAYEIV